MKYFKTLLIVLWIVGSFTGCNTDVINKDQKSSELQSSNQTQSTSQQQAANSGETKKTVSALQTSENPKITFIELGSVNCIPCRMMQPVMKQIEKEFAGQVKVIFYDVWTPAGKPYGQKYRIRAIPTQVFLDENGKEFHRHTGFYPFEEVKKLFAQKGVK